MKTVVIYSGGMDSTTLLYCLLKGAQEGGEVSEIKALGINYGQRHLKELEHARRICDDIGLPFDVAEISYLRHLLAGSSQTSDDIEVPEGHYAGENMKQTVVPNRNMIMLSVAIGHAISLGFDSVAYAAHAGDHAIYPDCRAAFATAMDAAAKLCHFYEVKLLRPFVGIDKTEIVRVGSKLGVPYEKTWSCYKGLELHCGKCGTCVERIEAFELAGVMDPTEYMKEE